MNTCLKCNRVVHPESPGALTPEFVCTIKGELCLRVNCHCTECTRNPGKRTFEDLVGIFKTRGQSFRLEYDVDYGIDRKSGWSVVINGSVEVQFAGTPQAALEAALERTGPRSRIRERIAEILDMNPCHNRKDGPDPDCVLCLIRQELGGDR